MADEVKMVVIDGVRYRPDDAPDDEAKRDTKPAGHKMRQPRTAKKRTG